MKKIVLTLFFTTLFLSSCVTPPKYRAFHYADDFKYLTEKGIFVTTSNTVIFDYKPIGIITSVSLGGIDENEKKKQQKELTDLQKQQMADYGGYIPSNTYKEANLQDAFKELYKGLQEIDANGIINLKIERSYLTSNYVGTRLTEIKITGLAIKK